MAHVPPLPLERIPDEVRPIIETFGERMGFVPNSLPTMARRPDVLRAFSDLTRAVLYQGEVDTSLKILVTLVASAAAGCRYCQAHMATRSTQVGYDEAKVAAVWEFETSPLFTEAERAALRLARAGSVVPNEATATHFDELRRHFTDDQVVEIVASMALFGFLNRWNDTLATELEDVPRQVAEATIGTGGWEPGKHGGSASG